MGRVLVGRDRQPARGHGADHLPLFIRRLDELHTAAENKANRLGQPIEGAIFSQDQSQLRWSRFKDSDPAEMHAIVGDQVFPFLRELGGDGSTYSHQMRDARLTIPTPALLSKVVDLLDGMPMEGRDTKGDVYEYTLSKIASAGQNGQFRTPRHIIELMVTMTAPQPSDEICDPACGTAGFLVASSEHIRKAHPEVLHDATQREHFHRSAPVRRFSRPPGSSAGRRGLGSTRRRRRPSLKMRG